MTFLNAADDVFDSIPEYRVRFNTDYAEKNACFLRLVSSDPENLNGLIKRDHGISKTVGTNDIKNFVPSCSRGDRTRFFLKVQDGCDY